MSISINTTNYEFRKLEINSQTVTRIRAGIVKTRERPDNPTSVYGLPHSPFLRGLLTLLALLLKVNSNISSHNLIAGHL